MENGLTTAQVEGMKATETVQQEIERKGLTAPRVKPEDINEAIDQVCFLYPAQVLELQGGQVTATSPLRLLTLCVVITKNGFTVVGKSACASFANFDRELGQRIALEDAKRQLWPLLGYALRDKLAAEGE